jgi:hypothetical protein
VHANLRVQIIFLQDPSGPTVTPDTSAADNSKNVGYTNGQLPDYCPNFTGSYFCPSALPSYTVAPFWDDLYIYANTAQGLYYEVDGTAPHRTASFEWYTSHYQASTEYYHFTIQFSESSPGAWIASYYQISDSGTSLVSFSYRSLLESVIYLLLIFPLQTAYSPNILSTHRILQTVLSCTTTPLRIPSRQRALLFVRLRRYSPSSKSFFSSRARFCRPSLVGSPARYRPSDNVNRLMFALM